MTKPKTGKQAKYKTGRPRSEMTPAVESLILRGVAEGLPLKMAARVAGVNENTAMAHKLRNPSFATAVEKAEGEAVNYYASKIRAAALKQWTAAAWWLERRHPNDWALRKPDLEVDPAEEKDDRWA
jgi:hypothetical protein